MGSREKDAITEIRRMPGIARTIGGVVLAAAEAQMARSAALLPQAREMASDSLSGDASLAPVLAAMLRETMLPSQKADPTFNPEMSMLSLESVAKAFISGGIKVADRIYWESGERFVDQDGLLVLPEWAESRLADIPEAAARLLASKTPETVVSVLYAPSHAAFNDNLSAAVGGELDRMVARGALATGAAALGLVAVGAAATPLAVGFATLTAFRVVTNGSASERGIARGVISEAAGLASECLRAIRDSEPAGALRDGVDSLRSKAGLRNLSTRREELPVEPHAVRLPDKGSKP